MHKNISKSLAIFTAAVMLSVAVVPMAQAQGPGESKAQLELKSAAVDPSNVKADITIATVSIPWNYQISEAGFGLQAEAATTTTMSWDDPFCDQPGIVITGPLTNLVTVTRASDGTSASAEDTKEFSLQATQAAPGETPIKCTFAAQVADLGSQVKQTDKMTTTGNLNVDFLGLLSANLPSTIKQAGPQKEINYDIELTNLGNSRSTVRFDLVTENVGKWDPVTPSEIILDSPNQAGDQTTKVVSFQVSTPFKNGWNNDQKTFQVRITPVSTKNPDQEGAPITLNVLSRVRGVYVPSLEPMIMLGAVLGAGLLAARLRDQE